ncbi:oxidoreductase [Micromonospora aurantiaca]|uniref:ferredoxin reductase family protein n=1 Tax=Micromonospora aurantiaca (nom. illeg.) TaxID=47850 RepID=UPI000F406FD0|nr:ferredoxin reductase family protein [Micromonospora aurantiaca]RNH98196.1 oxidoreductase [Micromonospora aurantiaca]
MTHRHSSRIVRPGGAALLALGTVLAGNVLIVDALLISAGPGKNTLLTIAKAVGVHAALLTMAQLVLISRLPWLDSRLGADRLTRWHRRLGTGLLGAVLLHGALAVFGYATLSEDSAFDTFSALAGVPASLMGITSGAVIVTVVLTSITHLRRRLPYELWHGIHLLLYLALVLGLLHQAMETTTFAASALAAVYWWCAWASVGILLLFGRIITPVWRNLRHGFRVAAVVPEAGNAVSIYVHGRRLDRFPARAGQFAIWRFPGFNPAWQANPFSLSARPDGHHLRLTVRAAGATSARLASMPTGTRVLVEGPYGAFTGLAKTRRDTLLIAVGVGITPVRALIEDLHGSVVVVYRVRSELTAPLLGEVRNLCRARRAPLHVLAGPRQSAPPLSGAYLAALVPDIHSRDVFICGPSAVTTTLLRSLRELGIPNTQLHAERFSLG